MLVMKRIIVVLVGVVTAVMSLWAKSESKFQESYAFNRGVEAYEDGDMQGALDWFNKELELHPDNGYAYIYISVVRLGNEDYGMSLSAINQALKKLPKKEKSYKSLAYRHRGNIYLAMGDTISGLGDFETAIKLDPENMKNYETRAQLYYELKRYDLSDADYKKMIDLDPGDVMGYMGIGRNAKCQDNWDDAVKQFNYVIKLAPDYSPGYSFRGEYYINQNRWPEAADDIVKALDIDGDEKAYSLMKNFPKEHVNTLKTKLKIQMAKQPKQQLWPFYLGVVADQNEEYDEAISYYEKANSIDAHPALLRNIANDYINKNNYSKALDYADRALAIDPEDYEGMSQRADILSNLGRYTECLEERDKYVAQYPESAYGYLCRAYDRQSARLNEEAIEDFNMVELLAPKISDVSSFFLNRGDSYRFIGKLAEANKDYNRVLELECDSVMTSESCSPLAYAHLGNSEKAIEKTREVLKNDTTAVALYNSACVYACIGNSAEALKCLKAAVDKGYDNYPRACQDYDLESLVSMPEFEEIMKSLKMKMEQNDILPEEDAADYRTEIVEVPFSKEGGVTKVKCEINGVPLHFVFDTGAADVTLSMVEANFMLKNDYIKPSDIIGTARYVDANGDISEGTTINLRKVNFGGLELENVRASVVRNQKAPLLLGQSVVGRLGKVEIDNVGMKLVITHKVRK